MSEKIYFNGVNGKKTMYGTRISINVEKFIEELKKYKNEAGYCNINVNDRKSPDKYGNNVYVTLDTWKPDASKKTSQPAHAAKVDDLDLPF
jgi:hypothetical protein